jgi:hypothetical protein
MKDEKGDDKIIEDGYGDEINLSQFGELMKEEIDRMTLEELKKLHKSVPDRIKLNLLLNKSKTRK